MLMWISLLNDDSTPEEYLKQIWLTQGCYFLRFKKKKITYIIIAFKFNAPFRGGGSGGGLRTSMAGVFILLLGPPKPDRLKDRSLKK